MTNYKLIIAYDGSRYFGWQKNGDGPSIEGELERTLSILLRSPVTLQAAGRTDRGVHAHGQVINFIAPPLTRPMPDFLRSLNAILPHDIKVSTVEPMFDQFHPTLDAKGKEYHYYLHLQQCADPFAYLYQWHLPHPLSIEAMKQGAEHFVGKHDFTALTNMQEPMRVDPICTIHSIEMCQTQPHELVVKITGDRFLYKMVRNLVGNLVYAGLGKLDPSTLSTLLASKDRTQGGVTAPASGLFLHKVIY